MRCVRRNRATDSAIDESQTSASSAFLPMNITSMMSFLYKKMTREQLLGSLKDPTKPINTDLSEDCNKFVKIFELHS